MSTPIEKLQLLSTISSCMYDAATGRPINSLHDIIRSCQEGCIQPHTCTILREALQHIRTVLSPLQKLEEIKIIAECMNNNYMRTVTGINRICGTPCTHERLTLCSRTRGILMDLV